MDGDEDDGGPSMSLSALEEKLKPEVLANFEEIDNLYKKLHKMQHRRLETITSGEEIICARKRAMRRSARNSSRKSARFGCTTTGSRNWSAS